MFCECVTGIKRLLDCVAEVLIQTGMHQAGAKNHVGSAHVVQIDVRRINNVLVTILDGNCVCVDARCCVVCRGLDIGNCVSFSQFWLILTGMHKLAGNHANVAHVLSSIGFRTCFVNCYFCELSRTGLSASCWM